MSGNMIAERTVDVVTLAGECESIGRNCEFGFVQRRLGVEPVSLLRWGGSSLGGLIQALDASFQSLALVVEGEPKIVGGRPDHSHWLMTCQTYDILLHGKTNIDVATAQEAARFCRPRMMWQAAKLLEQLHEADKILVYASKEIHSADDAAPLVEAVRRHGQSPILLVAEVEGSDSDVTETRWPNVWVASVPYLTEARAPESADHVVWGRVLENFGRLLGR